MGFVIGVDIGGTFTDCTVLTPDGRVVIGKSSSTPPDFEHGFVASIESAARRLGVPLTDLLDQADGIYHGCTVGTNALVQNRVARVGLITTRGHRDTIFMMQAGRRLINMPADVIARVATHTKPDPLVPKNLVVEVDERVAFDGQAVVALNDVSVREAVDTLIARDVEAIAISLLWSVVNPSHEERVEAIAREMAPECYVSRSSVVMPRVGEYERTVTTVINAAVGPVMAHYLQALRTELRRIGYRRDIQIMTCAGGLVDTAQAIQRPVLTIGSGPVAGLIGAQSLAASLGDRQGNVLTTDMGGTTFDVGVIRAGNPLSRASSWHGQYEYFVPTLDVRSVGSGGGSLIAYDEQRGTLQVGPDSAGARPGPVCYRRGGTQPTVSDADLVLGYLNADFFLDGEIGLDVEAARNALASVGAHLDMDADQTAAAATLIVDSHMADAIRLASIEQGYDPRELVMYAYGGAGPVHAAAVARELGIRSVIVPLSDLASGWSSFGIASADAVVVEELGQGMAEPFDVARIASVLAALEATAIGRLTAQGIDATTIVVERLADVRYKLQVNELEVRVPTGPIDRNALDLLLYQFEQDYERLYGQGTGYAAAGFAIAGFRVRATASISDFALKDAHVADGSGPAVSVGTRDVLFTGGGGNRVTAHIYRGSELTRGAAITGPAILEYPDTTVVLHPGDTAHVDQLGNLVLAVAPAFHSLALSDRSA